MKLLLDTHIWIWSALDRALLATRVVQALENPENELWLSPISLWEVLMLCQRRKLTLNPDPHTWIANTLQAVPMREAQMSFEIAQESVRVRLPHRDPADRFLIATARIYDLTLVTADQTLLKARPVSLMSNR